ncbi:unnamed protein product [Polarella glacialis]|uniref:Uncharacterized protein n=1 Tax=Polarella glacialis TaxID=89957 RepID=A0A813EV31_POLGL|nr:unnamed protein product [Polarella glacialis]
MPGQRLISVSQMAQGMRPLGPCRPFASFFRSRAQILVFLVSSSLTNTILFAFTSSFLAGAIGAILSEVRAVVAANQQYDPSWDNAAWYTNLLAQMQTVVLLVDDFKILPTFLIGFMINREVSRWLDWLRIMLSIQGRLHDLCLILASADSDVNHPEHGMRHRRQLFRWYRYCNAIHYLAYFKLVPSLGTSPDAILQDLHSVGLLVHHGTSKLMLFNMPNHVCWLCHSFFLLKGGIMLLDAVPG